MNKILTILFISLLCCTWSFAQCPLTSSVGSFCDITTSGTITIPAGVDIIEVKAWGAGGGSQGGSSNRRPGGGGGAYFSATYAVTPGQTVTATIGLGAPGADGGNTVFSVAGATGVTINGGIAGTNNTAGAGGAATAGGGVAGGVGGARSGAANGTGGGGGGSGPGATAGGPGTSMGGLAGAPGGGVGGNNGAGGTAGSSPGGAAGGTGSGTGIDIDLPGANGQVTVCVVGVLPVELVSFNANARNNQTLLEWQTASEENTRGFEIQKSKDGIAWDILEFVEGKGTAFGLNTYTFIDKKPTIGSNFYRLKQLDFDERFDFSKIVVVDFNRLNEVEMFPNPAKDQLTLVNGEGEVIIYNALGQAVKHLTIDAEQSTIQLAGLLNGQHYLQVIQKDGTVVMKQFVKVF